MIKTEISPLTKNHIIPFQSLHKEHELRFTEFNKMYATTVGTVFNF